MKVMILAAGRGTRISKLIGDIPKCTVNVGGEPLISRTVDMLRRFGVREIGICLGYKHEAVSRAIAGKGVREFVNPFYHVTNSIASLWFASDFLQGDEDLVICNGDVFWTEEIFRKIQRSDRDIVMLADRKRVDDGDYFFRTRDGVLLAYGKDLPREKRDCEYVGIAKIGASAIQEFVKRLDRMIDAQQCDKWWENVLYSMVEERPVYVEDVGSAFWAEVDFIEDYQRILDYVAGTNPR